MPPKKNVGGGMFDVRPRNISGKIAFDKIARLNPRVNLRFKNPRLLKISMLAKDNPVSLGVTSKPAIPDKLEPIINQYYESPKARIRKDFERELSETGDPLEVLSNIDKLLVPTATSSQVLNPVSSSAPRQDIRSAFSPASRDIERVLKGVSIESVNWADQSSSLSALSKLAMTDSYVLPTAPRLASSVDLTTSQLNDLWHSMATTSSVVPVKAKRRSVAGFFKRWALSFFIFTCLLVFVFWLSYSRGIYVRNNVLQNGQNAVANLEKAKSDLKEYHFATAADSFALAYDDLNRASGTLSGLGASFLTVFGNLPIINKLAAANNLVEAGQSISKSGENLSLAFSKLYSADLFNFINYQNPDKERQLSTLIKEFKAVLQFADTHINRAHSLLADIDSSAIPQDKQAVLKSFSDKIPEFQDYIGNALTYADFLLKFVGDKGDKRYMLLFQNNTELRPTGGFAGSYAIITFHNGYLKNVAMDDIYNIDGQIKENIIPPVPMQHITPNWGMRDANWFPDFPTSARKIEELYQKDGGLPVDGVLTMTPDVLMDILDVVGPIQMPEYGLTLTSANFLSQVQEEVEYGSNRAQPKTILKDLQPKLLAQIGSQGKDAWLLIFNAIFKRLAQKDILAYFNDSSLESIIKEHDLSGELKQAKGDYLQVVYSNVKGSKTDAFTDNSLDLKTQIDAQGEHIAHTLQISRLHRGGDQANGFYNRVNSAYMRVYVPRGAVLEAVIGQSITNYKPLLDYATSNFKKDDDLKALEDTLKNPVPGVDVYQESDKTVIGFWMVVKPKESQSVEVRYSVPGKYLSQGGYDLLWQKQSGNDRDKLHFSMIQPEGKMISQMSPDSKMIGDTMVLDGELNIDRDIRADFK